MPHITFELNSKPHPKHTVSITYHLKWLTFSVGVILLALVFHHLPFPLIALQPGLTSIVNLFFVETQSELISDIQSMRTQLGKLEIDLTESMNRDLVRQRTGEDIFTMAQYMSHFRVKPIDRVEVHPSLQDAMTQYDYRKDPVYLNHKELYDKLTEHYAPYMNRISSSDERFYIKWNNATQCYGLFAAVPMAYRSVLGIFTGVIQPMSNQHQYTWRWAGLLPGHPNLVINAQLKGNWFRFLTPHGEGNVKVIMFPYEKQWHLAFTATRTILADEMLNVAENTNYSVS